MVVARRSRQFGMRIFSRWQEQPRKTARTVSVLVRSVRRFGHHPIAALPGTIAPPAGPAAPVRDEANVAIAIRICAFHDTFLVERVTMLACSAKHCGSQ